MKQHDEIQYNNRLYHKIHIYIYNMINYISCIQFIQQLFSNIGPGRCHDDSQEDDNHLATGATGSAVLVETSRNHRKTIGKP